MLSFLLSAKIHLDLFDPAGVPGPLIALVVAFPQAAVL